MHPPRTPAASDRYGARPLTQVPLRRARTRTTTTTTRYERRTSNVERRDARVMSNNARAHVKTDVTTVTVTMSATMTATVVVLRVVVRRAHRVTRRRRWRWRWRCRRLHGASSALRVTHTASHARACARHHRASRKFVTVSVPPAHDRHARATAALARSIDRARGVALAMAVKEAVGYTARHMRHEKSASLAHTSTPSTHIARVITAFRSPRARASCGGGGARSSLDRAHAVWRRRWRWR